MMGSKETYRKGIRAEQLALNWLRLKGYTNLEQRFRCSFGEIDLVMLKGDCVCFIEVKGHANLEKAAEAIVPAQKRRISRSAAFWLQMNQEYAGFCMRFDAILVQDSHLLKTRVRHISNAWTLDDTGELW